MLKLKAFAAVIFDLDGLVLDTESTYQVAWQQAAEAMGCGLTDSFCRSMSGLSGPDVLQKLQQACGPDFDMATFNRLSGGFWRDFVNAHGIALKYGFSELLAYVVEQQLPYCLATNSSRVNALECLALAGIDGVFSVIVTRDDVQYGKPAPDIFHQAAQVMQVPIRQCLVLEDSPVGVLAARRAEATVLMVSSSDGSEHDTDIPGVSRVADLSAALALLQGNA